MNKRLLILTSEFPPLPGGIGNHAFCLATYLQQSGYEITVVSDYRGRENDDAFDTNQSFRITRIKKNAFRYGSRILMGWSHAKMQHAIIASGKFSLWLGAFLSVIYPNKKFIAVLHGSELKAGGKMGQFLTRWSLKRFDRYIAVSEFTKNKTLEILPKLTIMVINNGIQLERYLADYKSLEEPLSLITVGNLTFRKGQQHVIKALPLLLERFPSIHYNCVGIPTEKKRLVELASSLGVMDAITFHGALLEDEKVKLLQKNTVFIMLSDIIGNDFEGFGIAILEANALGLPAIGSKNSGIEDAIHDNYSGKLVDPYRPEDIANALQEIIENYKVYSENALKWATLFDWQTIIKKYIDVIEH